MRAFGIFAISLLAIWGLYWLYVQIAGSDEMDYRGERIKLTRKYVDYDAYKNERDNILESELPKIERMIVTAKVSSRFNNWAAFATEAGELKVPGYGFGGGPNIQATGRTFIISSIEIPTRPWGGKNRYFVLEQRPDQSLDLIDDFIGPDYPDLAEIKLVNDRLVYFNKSQMVIREKKL